MKYTLVAVNQPERFPILYSEVVTQYKTYAVEEDRAVIGDAEELVGGFVTSGNTSQVTGAFPGGRDKGTKKLEPY